MGPSLQSTSMRARGCLLVALAIILPACGGGGSSDDTAKAGNDVTINVPASGGSPAVQLAGVERGRGQVGVVLAHMLNSSQSAWSPLVTDLLDEGLHVLTFDFRGHGLSSGNRDPSHANLDLAAAVAKLRSLGATRIFVVGASMGGTAAIVVGASESLAGVVTLSAPAKIDALDAGAVAGKLTEPVLFIVGQKDEARYTDAARSFYAATHEPKRLEVMPDTAAHGTDLLTAGGGVGDRVQALIMGFLVDNRG